MDEKGYMQKLIYEMFLFPFEKSPIKIDFLLENNNEWNQILELNHPVLPLVKDLKCSLPCTFNLLVNDRCISTSEKPSVLDQ
jgi:hypothetical protein